MKIKFVFFILVFSSLHIFAQIEKGVYTCDEESFKLLKDLSDSRLKGGSILLFTTTHQDIAWWDHIEACKILRDTMWLTPFFERMRTEPDFKMDIEQTSIVMEYIHRHPEMKEVIQKYFDEGRLCVGGTYNQPYEELYAGESLSRQFYFGNKWLRDNFNGYKALTYFNADVPGRTLQMSQIMQKAGVENLVISRHGRGLFNWEAPDGSKARTYSPGHYIYFYNILKLNDTAAVKAMAKEAFLWYSEYNNVPKTRTVMPAMLNYEFTWDQKPVENCGPFTEKWNSITYIKTEKGRAIKVDLPKFKFGIADEFFLALDKSTSILPSIKGERPNVWLYIHGPTHEWAITASRKGDILLPAAEKLASFNSMINNNFNYYPTDRFRTAWEAKIYPDHGWGGKNGTITDNEFQRKYEFALAEASAMHDENLSLLASHVLTGTKTGRPVVVFNTLSWERKDPVVVDVRFEEGYAKNLSVTDISGTRIPCQLAEVTYYKDQSLCSAKLHFIATQVPAMGYKTYFINPDQKPPNSSNNLANSLLETPFYRIELQPGGIKQITDKELGVGLLNTSKFMGGEIITMQSRGTGAGEFAAIQQPTMEDFDKVSNYLPEWKVVENGEVYTSVVYRSKIRNAVIEQTIRAYHQIKKIDFDVAILNWEGILYREYRMMFPLSLQNAEISYEVPYGIVTVGKDEMSGAAGERYIMENEKIRPRGIINWIGAENSNIAVTLSSSVAVADFVDPTSDPVQYSILQPLLLAGRRSCHRLGNEYLQTGDHYYHFSLSSHKPERTAKMRFGNSSNEILQAVYDPKTYKDASLPTSMSFMDVQNENVVVSTIKKSEDDSSLIIRLYNLSEESVTLNPKFFKTPVKIIKTNLIEDEIEQVDKMILGKYAIETYKFKY